MNDLYDFGASQSNCLTQWQQQQQQTCDDALKLPRPNSMVVLMPDNHDNFLSACPCIQNNLIVVDCSMGRRTIVNVNVNDQSRFARADRWCKLIIFELIEIRCYAQDLSSPVCKSVD